MFGSSPLWFLTIIDVGSLPWPANIDDDGPGLDKSEFQNIIKPFYKEDKRFWSPPQLLIDLVNNGKNFDSLN